MSEKRPVLSAAAKRGNRRNTLVRLRDVVAYSIDNAEAARDVAALGRLMITVLEEIEAVPAPVGKPKKGTPLDEFTEHMLKRRGAAVPESAAGG